LNAYEFLLSFAREHWFLSWCALWLVWAPILLSRWVLVFTRSIIIRTYRTVMVATRGWPPAHLDADGDWRQLPKVAAKTETATVGDKSHTTTHARQM